MELRPYQRAAIDALMRGWDGGDNRQAVVLPTGSGKTVVFSHLIFEMRRYGVRRSLVIAHREELLDQAADKIKKVAPHLKVGVYQGSRKEYKNKDVVVASVQTLGYRRPCLNKIVNEDGSIRSRCGECTRCNTLVNAREVGDFDLIIVDECFPAGTTVGGRPIEDLQKGDLVPSWNEKTGRTEHRRVAAVMRKVPQAMVKVSFNGREDLVCTPNHPILTEDGWCPAGMLQRGASVVSFTHDTGTAARSTLYGMLDVGADQGQEAEEPVQEKRKGLLHAGVQGCMGEEGPVAEDVGDEPEVRIGEDAEEEPHARSGVCSEDEGHSGENGTSPRIQGRERKARSDAAAASGGPSRMAYGSSDSAGRSGTSVSLSSGYSASDHESGSGGGWGIPLLQGAPSLRPAEGQKVVLSRVDSVQVLEPGSDGTYGGLCPDGAVYNIEVEGTHTYLIDDGLVVHNCHHAASQSYRRVLRHFGAWEGVPVAGFTATMTRQQGGLDKVWHDVAYRREIAEMINDGYLVAPKGKQVVVKDMDLSKAKVTAGDFTTKSLSDLMLDSSAMTDIASAYKEHASDRPGIVFCPTVAVAHEMAEAFKAEGITAATVWGAMTNDERRHTLSRFSSGEVQVLVNCMVLCLDEETEILTSSGWVGPDEMTKQHRVANWDQGRVFFTEPREVVVRPRAEWEDMYTLETSHRSIRVTGGHRMLYRTYDNGQYKKAPVEELANKRLRLPTTGWAEPEHPSKLTLDQAALVGFWIGDGTKTRASRGGVSYVVSQSHRYRAIIEWFDGVLERTGIQAKRYDNQHYAVPHVRWALPRGTGGKSQQRQGVKEFEEYLDKDGSDLLWNLDTEQFDAFLTGLWYADGNHGLAENGRPDSFWISGTRKHLFDKLQAIASVRGWTTNLYKETAPRSERHKQVWRLSFHQRTEHKIGGDKPEYRIQREAAPHRQERAWCVKTETRNIITRRRGTVTVMGNTEGFDEPKASCLVVARPTKNHGLYIQMVGRVLRLSPETGKTDALILDVTGATTRHKLATVSDLTGKKKGVKGTKHGEADDEPDGTEIKPETETGVQMEKELLAIGGWRDVDLMSATSGARWLRSPKGYRFVLADDRAYFAVPAVVEGMYHLRMVHKGVPVVPPGDPSDTLEKAMAELDRIGLAKASTYDNVSAPWRSRPASEKLRRFAEKMHIDLPENVRAGDVSDAIAVKKNGTQVDRIVEEHERRLKEARGV